MKKIMICILILALLLPIFTVYAAEGTEEDATPAEDLTQAEDVTQAEQFSSPFEIENCVDGELSYLDGAAVLDIKSGEAGIVFSPKAGEIDKNSNSIRIVLENSSSCKSLTIQIEYELDGKVQTENTSLKIEATPEKRTYFLNFEHMSTVTKITVSFGSVSSGKIAFYSFEDTYMYEGKAEETLLSDGVNFYFDYESYSVKISGSIGSSTYNKYKGSTIQIYRTKIGESAIDSDAKPVMENNKMSIEFDYEIKVKNLLEAYSQYSVVLKNTENNEKKLLCAPKVPVMYPTQGDDYEDIGFKGIQSSVVSDVIDINSNIVSVDIPLTALESKDGTGYYFDMDGQDYIFVRSYFIELDKIMESYSKANCKIYLNFELSDSDKTNINDEDFRRKLFSYTYYILQRYIENDSIVGITLSNKDGKGADRFNCADKKSLEQYINSYSACIFAISEAIKLSGKSIRVIVPISDTYECRSFDSNGYNSENFLYAISENLTKVFFEFGKFFVRLNSDFSPAYFDTELERCVLADPRQQDRYSASNISDFDMMLLGLCQKYDNVSEKYHYFWEISESASNVITAGYIYNFLQLYFESKAESFIASLSRIEKSEDFSVFSKLKYTVKYIDTSKFSDIAATMFELFDISDYKSLIPNFNKNEIFSFRLFEVDMTKLPSNLKGRYYLWDFENRQEYAEWTAVNGCKSLATGSSAFGKGLIAKMQAHSAVTGEYSSIICSFDNPFDLSYSDYLTYDLSIDCKDSGAVFELMLVFGFENGVAEAKQIVEAGNKMELNVNTDNFGKLSYVQINIKPISNQNIEYDLCVQRVYQSSLRYNDEQLEEFVNLNNNDGEDNNPFSNVFLTNVEIFCIAFIFSAVLIAFFVILKKIDKKK